jgi:isopentenyl-diphosphate Delta-isomerase
MNDDREVVVLVDRDDVELGTAPKLEAHRSGELHRAFSVFVLNGRGELLLQRRARGKYHSGGLWSNSCCGHPRPGEDTTDAAHRRLLEEFGIACELTRLFSFAYRAELGNGLVEHELDHVLVGFTGAAPEPNPAEIEEWRWMGLEEVRIWMDDEPDAFTPWFRPAYTRLLRPALRAEPIPLA